MAARPLLHPGPGGVLELVLWNLCLPWVLQGQGWGLCRLEACPVSWDGVSVKAGMVGLGQWDLYTTIIFFSFFFFYFSFLFKPLCASVGGGFGLGDSVWDVQLPAGAGF